MLDMISFHNCWVSYTILYQCQEQNIQVHRASRTGHQVRVKEKFFTCSVLREPRSLSMHNQFLRNSWWNWSLDISWGWRLQIWRKSHFLVEISSKTIEMVHLTCFSCSGFFWFWSQNLKNPYRDCRSPWFSPNSLQIRPKGGGTAQWIILRSNSLA